MNKILKSCAILVLPFVLAGCSSLNQGVTSAKLDYSVSASNEAKVTVGSKVSATAEGTIFLGIFKDMPDEKFADGVEYAGTGKMHMSFMDSSSALKSAAAYKAMQKSGADVLVAPTYVTEIKDSFFVKRIKVTVTAYKGTITSFK